MPSACKAKAREVGASHVLDPNECDVLAEMRAHPGPGRRRQLRMHRQQAHRQARHRAIRKADTCVLAGNFEEPSSFNFFERVATEKQVLGALAYNGEFADVIAFIVDGRLDITPLVTGRIELEQIVEKGFEELVHNKEHNMKIIVSPRAA